MVWAYTCFPLNASNPWKFRIENDISAHCPLELMLFVLLFIQVCGFCYLNAKKWPNCEAMISCELIGVSSTWQPTFITIGITIAEIIKSKALEKTRKIWMQKLSDWGMRSNKRSKQSNSNSVIWSLVELFSCRINSSCFHPYFWFRHF